MRAVATMFALLVTVAAPGAGGAEETIAPLPSSPEQIATATVAAPAAARETATVYGYTAAYELVTLRSGEGELVCLADDPREARFHVACYHRDLEPFMARGRQLRAQGLARDALVAQREKEIAEGLLPMPDGPRALYSLTGPAGSYDASGGDTSRLNRVSVIYIPYATEASTGLPPEPAVPGAPWIMAAGKPWAHIMVVQAAARE